MFVSIPFVVPAHTCMPLRYCIITFPVIFYFRSYYYTQFVFTSLQDSNPSREQPIYPSSILSPINRSPPPISLTPPPTHHGGVVPRPRHPCIDLPLPKGRLEPGEGIKMSLILQGLLPPSLFVPSTEVPWHILFYYEPALITANSRIR